MGSRKASSKLRRSGLQLKNMQAITESSMNPRASVHMQSVVRQPDVTTQLSTQSVNRTVEADSARPAKDRRRAVPARTSRTCLVNTMVAVRGQRGCQQEIGLNSKSLNMGLILILFFSTSYGEGGRCVSYACATRAPTRG